MLKADREFRREVRRLVGETGKVCRELTWYEGQSGNTTRHFYEKWKRAEIDNVIGMVANRPSARMEAASPSEIAKLVKAELASIAERFKRQVVSATPKKAPKQKKAE